MKPDNYFCQAFGHRVKLVLKFDENQVGEILCQRCSVLIGFWKKNDLHWCQWGACQSETTVKRINEVKTDEGRRWDALYICSKGHAMKIVDHDKDGNIVWERA